MKNLYAVLFVAFFLFAEVACSMGPSRFGEAGDWDWHRQQAQEFNDYKPSKGH